MANQLKMAEQHTILVLARQGWSFRRIARELDIHRETVTRYVRLAQDQPPTAIPPPENPPAAISPPENPPAAIPPSESPPPEVVPEPAISIIGSSAAKPAISIIGAPEAKPAISIIGAPEAKPAISIIGSAEPGRDALTGRRSQCAPFREVILEMLERGLSAQRIWQDLRAEHGFADSYQSVQRFVRKLRGASPPPFRRMECEPGFEAQVDFGQAAPVVTPDGKRRRPHLFRIVLSHSRKAYSEAVERQTTEEFLRCLENAFHHFGGVPKTLVIDNLKAAVNRADWYDPELHPKILAFGDHYGTAILPTKPYTPRHKGKIERGVGYAQDNALRGRTFSSLQEQNQYLWEWERSVADTRIHGTIRKQVGPLFTAVERPALLPLPVERFPCFQEAQRSVHRDAHVAVGQAYYSVPPEFVGRKVWVRWDSHVVRIFDQKLTQIAVHARREAGRFATRPEHIASEKIAGVERGTAWLLRKVALVGPETGRWAGAMLEHRGIAGVRVLVGLLALTRRYSDLQVEQACACARSHGAYRLRVIRELIKRQAPPQEEFEFTQEHPLIRPLAAYGQLVRTAFQEVYACQE